MAAIIQLRPVIRIFRRKLEANVENRRRHSVSMAGRQPAWAAANLSDSAEKGKFYDRESVTVNNGEFMERVRRNREGEKREREGE